MSAATQRLASIEAIRDITANRQAAKLRFPTTNRRVLCDIFTASAIVAVYDAVNADNKAKFARMVAASPAQFARAAQFCLKHVERQTRQIHKE